MHLFTIVDHKCFIEMMLWHSFKWLIVWFLFLFVCLFFFLLKCLSIFLLAASTRLTCLATAVWGRKTERKAFWIASIRTTFLIHLRAGGISQEAKKIWEYLKNPPPTETLKPLVRIRICLYTACLFIFSLFTLNMHYVMSPTLPYTDVSS